MNALDEKTLFEEIRALLDSEALVTARLVESVAKVSQLSSVTHPEIEMLFRHWFSIVTREIKRSLEFGKEFSVPASAQEIGISPSVYLALLLQLQRQGEISVQSITIAQGTGKNEDICSCLADDHG